MEIPEIEIGAGMLILAGISGALLAAIIKWGMYAFSIELLMLVRWGTGLLLLTIVLWIKKSFPALRTQRPGGHLATAVCYLASMYCFYLAMRLITVAQALLLLNTAPLFAPVLSRVILKKKDHKSIWIAIIIGFVGVVVILRPGAAVFQQTSLIGLLAGLLQGSWMLLNAQMIKTEPKERISFYTLLFGSVLCVVIVAMTGVHFPHWQERLFPPRDWFRPWVEYPEVILAVVAIGLFTMFQPLLRSGAYKHGTVGELGPFRYASVLCAAILDWIFWNQLPTLETIVGFFLISGGGIIAIVMGTRKKGS